MYIQFAVQQLVAIPQGSMVELGIHHPVLADSDFSDSSNFSPLPPTSPSHDPHDPQMFLPRFPHHEEDDLERLRTQTQEDAIPVSE